MTTRPAAPGERTATLDVTLLGRDYKVACKESERAELQDAVAFVDRRMREIRDAGKSAAGVERVAVMAALNIAHDLLRERRAAAAAPARAAAVPSTPGNGVDEANVRRRIADMQSAIDQVLAGQEKLF
jgi:cell division protein ZapA